jgi:uncharacterized protein (DUF427 family)
LAKAIWNGIVIAESDSAEEVEGNIYFPPDSVKHEYLSKSNKSSVCPWKGTASYFTLNVDGEENADAAWSYPEPKEKAEYIRNFVAFWNGVEVER